MSRPAIIHGPRFEEDHEGPLRPEWLAAVFGASIAGCVAVPLSTFSTEPELDYLLKVSAVSVLLAERYVAKKDLAAMLTSEQLKLHDPQCVYPFITTEQA